MVNSRSEYDEKRRDEAVRRLRYSHPIVVSRCRHAKEAWKDTPHGIKDIRDKTDIELVLTPNIRHDITSCPSTRLSTRKSPLRGLFSAGNDKQSLTCKGDILICQNIESFGNEMKLPYIKGPYIAPHCTPRDDEFSNREIEKKNTSHITSHSYIDVPEHFQGWGRRRDNISHKQNKANKLKLNIKPLLRENITNKSQNMDGSEIKEKLWFHAESCVNRITHVETRSVKLTSKLNISLGNKSLVPW